jgi:Family of unknown function (DUF6069)
MTDTIHTAATNIRLADTTTPTVWRHGLTAGLAAAAATTAAATIARQSGVSMTIAGEAIPTVAFAQLTVIGALIGVALAAIFAHRSDRPRALFVRTTTILTLLSLVPDVVADADIATRFLLAATHLIAAAIIIPVLTRRLEH